jgi:N-methylhydantoinase A
MDNTTQEVKLRIGIDIGGTFTDFVIYNSNSGEIFTYKYPSTPEDPSKAVLLGLEEGLGELGLIGVPIEFQVVHGSTIATNALLERKGATTALITTEGFKDVIQIGRQNRLSLYDFRVEIPAPLIPASLRFEMKERVGPLGNIIQPLDQTELDDLISSIQTQKIDAVAICLLFSFANPIHEQAIKEILVRCLNDSTLTSPLFISASHEVLPEYREYERTSTTAVNAYVSPVMSKYLSRLEDMLPVKFKKNLHGSVKFRVMQSNGGSIRIEEAQKYGVRCILSGPAGGVTGAQFMGNKISFEEIINKSDAQGQSTIKIITLDMGGTSTDVALIDGEPAITKETIIAGCPIGIPVLDIHTIGAGGGSIARVDAGGALRVGPKSAGAEPGPACYGSGSFPTVTDANFILGRMTEDNFLGGRKKLFKTRSLEVLTELGQKIGLDPYLTALGIIEISNTHMERALRVISVERGHDPRDFSLISFGGAGGLHAADLARRLSIPRVIIPPMAATLSAFGMLVADVIKDYSQTVMIPGETPLIEISEALERLVRTGMPNVLDEGIPEGDTTIERLLDVRYVGQSYELTIPFNNRFRDQFHNVHLRWYGYNRPLENIEIVNIRVRIVGHIKPPKLIAHQGLPSDLSNALLGKRPVILGKLPRWLDVSFYTGEKLAAGTQIYGPAIIVREDTTVYLGPSDSGMVDNYLNLVIKIDSHNDPTT